MQPARHARPSHPRVGPACRRPARQVRVPTGRGLRGLGPYTPPVSLPELSPSNNSACISAATVERRRLGRAAAARGAAGLRDGAGPAQRPGGYRPRKGVRPRNLCRKGRWILRRRTSWPGTHRMLAAGHGSGPARGPSGRRLGRPGAGRRSVPAALGPAGAAGGAGAAAAATARERTRRTGSRA